MLRSLYSGISGLKNHQIKMDVIGNNIANVNTTGFKRSSVTFATMLSQNLKVASTPTDNQGGTNAQQIGLGVKLGAINQIMTQGSTQSTGSTTDLMLQGAGFFVLDNAGQRVYTRAGGFLQDKEGFLSDPSSGARVQGFSWGDDDSKDPEWDEEDLGNIKFGLGDKLTVGSNTSVVEKTYEYTPKADNISPIANTVASLKGAKNLKIEGMTEVQYPPTKNDEFQFNPDTGELKFFTTIDTTEKLSITYDAPTTEDVEYTLIADSKTEESLIGAQNLKIEGMKQVVGVPTQADHFQFDPDTGKLTFFTGIDTETELTISYDNPITDPITEEVKHTPTGGTDTVESLIGAQNVKIVGMTEVQGPPTQPEHFQFDPETGELNFFTGIDTTTELTIKYDPPTIDVKYTPTADTFTVGSLKGAQNLQIEGMTQVPGTPTEAGDFQFDPETGTLNFHSDFDTTKKITISYDAPTTKVVEHTPTSANAVAALVGAKNLKIEGMKEVLGTPTQIDEFQFNSETGQLNFHEDIDTTKELSISYDATVANPATYTLTGFSINQDGLITGVYSDGVNSISHKIAQIAVAKFPNDSGLSNLGGSFYSTTLNSGEPEIGAASSDGRASIISSTVEMSNVDLAQEFTDMIVTQRGFQANSKVITTSDLLLQELIDLKR